MGKVLDFKKKSTTPEVEPPKRKVWNPHLKSDHLDNEDEFGNRMDRIRESLEKINQLMSDLKGTNKNVDDKPTNS